jgi:hypothetical protein
MLEVRSRNGDVTGTRQHVFSLRGDRHEDMQFFLLFVSRKEVMTAWADEQW